MSTAITTSQGDNVPISIENQVFFNGKFIDVPDHSPEALYQQFVTLVGDLGSTVDLVEKQFAGGPGGESNEYSVALKAGKLNTFQFCVLLLIYNRFLKMAALGARH